MKIVALNFNVAHFSFRSLVPQKSEPKTEWWNDILLSRDCGRGTVRALGLCTASRTLSSPSCMCWYFLSREELRRRTQIYNYEPSIEQWKLNVVGEHSTLLPLQLSRKRWLIATLCFIAATLHCSTSHSDLFPPVHDESPMRQYQAVPKKALGGK